VFGLVDDESDLWQAVEAAGVFAVTALGTPGGLFATGDWRETPYGPVPAQPRTWVGCRLVGSRPAGWALLLEAELVEVELAEVTPLIHHRGRYRAVD
jgi:hypothetical protein